MFYHILCVLNIFFHLWPEFIPQILYLYTYHVIIKWRLNGLTEYVITLNGSHVIHL